MSDQNSLENKLEDFDNERCDKLIAEYRDLRLKCAVMSEQCSAIRQQFVNLNQQFVNLSQLHGNIEKSMEKLEGQGKLDEDIKNLKFVKKLLVQCFHLLRLNFYMFKRRRFLE